MFFSVIIPIYNVERHIRRGLETLAAQEYSDFEVILVDDGSTDSSGRLCEEAARTSENIKVIHTVNQGAGPARNVGIAAARGEYLLFFDIDDLLKPLAYRRIYDALKANPVDVLVFGYEEVNPYLKTSHVYSFPEKNCSTNDEIKTIYPDVLSGMNLTNGFVWNKAYSRRFIVNNGIEFEPLRIQQDEVFNLAVYPKATTLSTIPDVLYTYFVYDNGNTRSRFIPERLEIYMRVIDAFLDLYSRWGLDDRKFLNYVHKRFLDSLIYHINFNVFHPQSSFRGRERVEEISRIMQHPCVRTTVAALHDSSSVKDSSRRARYYKAIADASPRRYLSLYRRERVKTVFKKFVRRLLRR